VMVVVVMMMLMMVMIRPLLVVEDLTDPTVGTRPGDLEVRMVLDGRKQHSRRRPS
jgi:hypothetical protein